jgi:hypothetical protein
MLRHYLLPSFFTKTVVRTGFSAITEGRATFRRQIWHHPNGLEGL